MDDQGTRNARFALEQLLELRQGEHFLVVGDDATAEVADAFRTAGEQLGASVAYYRMREADRPLTSIPEDLMALVPDTDIAVTCFSSREDETPFRVSLIGALTRVVRRLGHAPGITTQMLTSGPMNVDYDAMALEAYALIRRFAGAQQILVTAPGGTSLELSVAGRPFQTDTVVADGKWGNLPAGEIWCAPVEDAANGVLVCDGTIGDMGTVPSPVTLTVEAGRVVSVTCKDEAFARRVEAAIAVDDGARVIGELGIGLNPSARLTGNLLEDEKARRTAHVAFGNNLDMGGGRNASKTHRDFLFADPTFEVVHDDGRKTRPIVAGEIVHELPPTRRDAPHPYKQILAAVDFSDMGPAVLSAADGIANRNGATLTVCHVITRTPVISPLFPQYVAMPDTSHSIEEAALEQLDLLVRDVTGRGPSEYTAIVALGDPAIEILALAEKNAVDLIVTANRSTGALRRMVLGTVAQAVAQDANCHVLLVRHRAAETSES